MDAIRRLILSVIYCAQDILAIVILILAGMYVILALVLPMYLLLRWILTGEGI